MSSLPRTLQAILLMTLAMFCMSMMNALIHLLSGAMASSQMVLLRNLFSLPIILLWSAAKQQGMPRFPTQRLSSHFWRATVGIISMELWFYSITVMPLNIATALSFTTPIFSTIFAIIFLGEKAGWRRWCAIMSGFAGMLIILRPDMGLVHPNAGIVLISSGFMAVAGVLVKSLTRTETPETIVFYMALFMIPWSVPLAVYQWAPLSLHHAYIILLIALLSTSAHLFMTRAFVRADLVVLTPFDFTRLIFTAALAYLLFDEIIDRYTVIGALVIVASTAYIAHREARKRGK